MFAKYNINFWFNEVAEFRRFFIEALRSMFWIFVVPIIMCLRIVKMVVNLFFMAPKLKKQVEPGVWEEVQRQELNYPIKM